MPTDADAVWEELQLKLQAWIYQVARNGIVDHYRRHKKTQELPPDLAVAAMNQWLWMQRMNGVFYPGAGYWVEAYQFSRGGLEETAGAARESALILDSGA